MKTIFQLKIGIVILFVFHISIGQERIITGQVLGQDLVELPGVFIMTSNSKIIDTTDFNGRFRLKYMPEIKKIKFVSLMIQSEEIVVLENCNHIEIILLNEWIYDFVSLKAAKRKRKRDRKRILPKLYAEAFEKGLFDKENPCKYQYP